MAGGLAGVVVEDAEPVTERWNRCFSQPGTMYGSDAKPISDPTVGKHNINQTSTVTVRPSLTPPMYRR